MRHTTRFITSFFVAGLAVSCAPADGEAASQRDKAKKEVSEAAQATQD